MSDELEKSAELNIAERRDRIVQLVNREGMVRVTDLSRSFGISEVTIRNDLTELERLDLLERIHGGAVRTNKSYYRMSTHERMSANKAEKVAIADHVRTMVSEGDTVFLNSGTTTAYIAREIKDIRNILVITNSPQGAQELAFSERCEVILVGGSYNGPLGFTFGDDAVKQIGRYRANKFFFACDGVSAASGAMIHTTREVDVTTAFMENSSSTIAVADMSKIGRMSRIAVCPVTALDTLVTNASADAAELDAIRAAGVDVIVLP